MKKKQITKKDVLKTLKDAGIKVAEYARSPVPGTGFIVNDDNGRQIRMFIKEDRCNIVSCSGNKQYKQAILTVKEGARTVDMDFNHKINLSYLATDYNFDKDDNQIYEYNKEKDIRESLRWTLESICQGRVHVPNYNRDNLSENFDDVIDEVIASIKKRKKEFKTPKDFAEGEQWGTYSIKAKYKSAGTQISVLVGVDESSYFVSVLPRRCDTVVEAHKALRPDVSSKAKRQGEWFFDPVTDVKLQKELDASIARAASKYGGSDVSRPLGRTHSMTMATNRGATQYAMGLVTEDRPNRHAPLKLSNWHKVVRNKEKKMPKTASGRVNVD